jgi:hypothetical protein
MPGVKKSNQKKAPFFAKGVFADRTSMCVRRTARIVRAISGCAIWVEKLQFT